MKNNPVVFTVGDQYFPHLIYIKPILEKYSRQENPSFVKLETRSLLGLESSAKPRSVFEEDFRLCDKTKEYKGYGFLAVAAALLLSLLSTPYLILKCGVQKVLTKQTFLYCLLRVKLNRVVLGDCICSLALRSNSPHGMLKVNYGLIQSIRSICFQYHVVDLFLRFSKLIAKRHNNYFICPEMSYADEMKRRVLLNKDCIELRLEFSTGGVQPIMERTNGTETLIRIFNTPPKENFDIKSADTQMHDFVFRNTAYLQLPDCDVDKSLQLSSSDYQREFISSNSKVAVIFLHQISDAAYLFGVDCFDDLHEWLMKSIEILLDENIGVLIKIHPAYFSKSMTYPIDLKYAEHLESHFGVDFGTMSKNGLHPSLLTNVAFIHHEIPAFELSRSFPGFLCITHHGTVAPEMAYLGHVSLVSTASPYLDSATFLKRYSSIEEYTQYVKSWSLGALRLDAGAKESLLRYMSCRNNVDLQEKKLENIRNLFGFTMETNNQFLGYMLNMTRCSEGYKRLVAHLRFDIEE